MRWFLEWALAFAVVCPATATWIKPDETVPLDRLVENLKGVLAENPDDSQAVYTLGRAYGLAYALGRQDFEVYHHSGRWDIATYSVNIPQPVKSQQLPPERLAFLAESIRHHQQAVTMEKDNWLYWLGLAYGCHEASKQADQMTWPFSGTPFDEECKAGAKDRLFWENKALEAYRKSIHPVEAANPFGANVSEEAAAGIWTILEGRENRSEAEHREMRRMKRKATSSAVQPRAITPLIFSFGNEPFQELTDAHAAVSFDLDGFDRGFQWSWVRPGMALLVWDPAGEGRITSGRQLIGAATWWMFWRDAYQVLAALDDNGDGWLRGAELAGLAVWQDRNGNAVSEPGEVAPVAARGVAAVNTRSSGNCGGILTADRGIVFTDGVSVATYDWIGTGSAR